MIGDWNPLDNGSHINERENQIDTLTNLLEILSESEHPLHSFFNRAAQIVIERTLS